MWTCLITDDNNDDKDRDNGEGDGDMSSEIWCNRSCLLGCQGKGIWYDKVADELDLRKSSVVQSKGINIRVDYGMRKKEDEILE